MDHNTDPHAAAAGEVMRYQNLVAGTAARLGIAPAMLLAVIHVESAGNVDAFRVDKVNGDAYFGLTQLALSQARGLGYFGPPRMLFDPAANIELTAQILAALLHRYKEPFLALVAGKGGRRAVWWYKWGWQLGAAVRYARAVEGFTYYYARILAALGADRHPNQV